MLLTQLTTVALTATLLIIGCKKETSDTLSAKEEEQVVTFTSESEIEAQFVFDDITDNVLGVDDEVGLGGVGIFGRTTGTASTEKVDSVPSCVHLTISPLQRNVFPKTVVMDFGTGCRVHDNTRSGKIITVYTGRLTEPGKSATTTFENFKIDSIQVTGTHKITNSTVAGASQHQFTIEVSGAKLTRPNGDFEEWNTTRVHTQVEGNGTAAPIDDVFRITGSSEGKTKRENLLVAWMAQITEPLVKRFTCRWLSKGVIKTVRKGLPTNTPWIGLLNFGDGTCNNKATLTVNGNVREITLH